MRAISSLVITIFVSACIFLVSDRQGPWHAVFYQWPDSMFQGTLVAVPTFFLVALPVFAWLRRSKRELRPASVFLVGALSGIAVVTLIALIARGTLSGTALTAAALGGGAGFLTYSLFRRTPFAQRFWSGCLIAWVGAYLLVFGSALLSPNEWSFTGFREFVLLLIFVGYTTLVWSWFVLPLGGLVGVWMPRLVKQSNWGIAFMFGTILGALIGCAAVLIELIPSALHITGSQHITGLQLEMAQTTFLQTLLKQVATIIPFAAVWVGLWAIGLNRRAANEGSA